MNLKVFTRLKLSSFKVKIFSTCYDPAKFQTKIYSIENKLRANKGKLYRNKIFLLPFLRYSINVKKVWHEFMAQKLHKKKLKIRSKEMHFMSILQSLHFLSCRSRNFVYVLYLFGRWLIFMQRKMWMNQEHKNFQTRVEETLRPIADIDT